MTKTLLMMVEQVVLIGSAEYREPLDEALGDLCLLVSLKENQHLEEDVPKVKWIDPTHQPPYHSKITRMQNLPRNVDVV
jgi:hypothetical protein